MLIHRPAAERGRLLDPGLSGTAAFSHGSAFDRDWLGFHALRVLNRVELAPGIRLPAARRANMEVLTLVLSGTYRAVSQAGDSGPVAAGRWHRLGAGAGVDVVECNDDPAAPLRFLQLWVQPTHSNAAPTQTAWAPGVGASRIAGPAPASGPAPGIVWGAAATVRRESVVPGAAIALPATRDGACWVEVVGGELAHGGRFLRGGDGLGVHGEAGLALVSSFGADLLVVELPG
jgi:redox-sensitive bicupin YhaK (pirin superfamily)